MNKFAFLVQHQEDRRSNKAFKLFSKIFSSQHAPRFIKDSSGIKIYEINKEILSVKQKVNGFLLAMPEHRAAADSDRLLNTILEANNLAQELGVKLLGLDNIFSDAAEKLIGFTKKLKVPVTSGDTFNAWSVFEAVYRTAKNKKIDLKKSRLTIIGACSATGALCAKKFSSIVNEMSLHCIEEKKLQSLREEISGINSGQFVTTTSVLNAIENADIIIFAAKLPQPALSLETIKPGAIVVDACNCAQIREKLKTRKDIIFLKAGLIKVPFPLRLPYPRLPARIVPAALAETMLLSLRQKFTYYSLGSNINPDKMDEIADIATAHDFEVWVPEAPIN